MYKIVAAFQGMHAKQLCPTTKKVWLLDRYTDRQMSDKVIPMCGYALQATQTFGDLDMTSVIIHRFCVLLIFPDTIIVVAFGLETLQVMNYYWWLGYYCSSLPKNVPLHALASRLIASLTWGELHDIKRSDLYNGKCSWRHDRLTSLCCERTDIFLQIIIFFYLQIFICHL